MDLDEKKVAVITGGASGIGLATARVLAGSGVKLVLGDIEEEPLKNALEELHAMGASAIGVRTDVANEEDVIALRDAALREYGGAHVVFNNAGVVGGPCIATPKKVWDWVFSINIDGVVNGINAFVPLFLEQNEGHVVNTASLAGLGGMPGMGAYCASKFAVVGISESLFHELAMSQKNVGVSVLCPGFVKTRIHESARNMPNELVSYNEDPMVKIVTDVATNAVNAGIDAADVGVAVANAIRDNRFFILTHERVAIRTTEQRLGWMQGGPPLGVNIEAATKP
jgi:NAD(P)-dependent dehydrogenase (short-subunit alcohol dehydrogenase family)